jgi:hypothetical protein
VSPTVTVSAPGSGYVRSAAVHAGVPGHPAADAGDCTQATKRQAPRRTVMITADCVPCLFRQMGARHRNSPGRRIRHGRSGRYHCSSGPCWPVMTREDPGERAVARTAHFQRDGWVSRTRPELGFCWWQVLGSNQRRLSRRFYRYPPTCLWAAQTYTRHDFLRVFSARSTSCDNKQGESDGKLVAAVSPL